MASNCKHVLLDLYSVDRQQSYFALTLTLMNETKLFFLISCCGKIIFKIKTVLGKIKNQIVILKQFMALVTC